MRTFKIILWIILLFTAWIILIAYGWNMPDTDPYSLSLEYANAPEQTAYLDILIKLSEEDENYVDFTAPPYYLESGYQKGDSLPIDETSPIARLDEDGYVSMSLHYRGTDSLTIDFNHAICLELDYHTQNTIEEVYQNYGRFKAAYVDENGNVLGITTLSRKKYQPKKSNLLIADGKNLIFQISAVPLPAEVLLTVFFYGGTLSVPILIILDMILRIREKKQSADMIKSIQNQEHR